MKTIYGKTVIILCLIIKSLDCTPVCAPRQVQRLSPSGELICCNTVICQQGQKYDFCDQNQGNDTCSNCPEGMYHLDKINTAVMSMMLDPCIQRPTCEQPEVVLVNGRCICDRSRGYYGYDENNCLLAEVQCSSPGFELSNTGKCEPCQEEYFKSEASSDYICQPKSRCPDSQDIANNGSATTDRTCRAKQSIERHVQRLENKTTELLYMNDSEQTINTKVDELEKRIAALEEENVTIKRKLKNCQKKIERLLREKKRKTKGRKKKRKTKRTKNNKRTRKGKRQNKENV